MLVVPRQARSAWEGLDRSLYLLKLRRRYGTQPSVVFSLPKVGSTTLLRAVRGAGRATMHVHRLSPSGRARLAARTRTGAAASPRAATQERRALWRSEYLAARLDGRPSRQDGGARWEIITGVRDPIARSISSFFHAGERTARGESVASGEADLDTLRRRWIEHYRRGAGDRWFDDELRGVTGIDVFAAPFPVARGFDTYANDRFRVILIRAEDITRIGSAALEEFLGTPVPRVSASNRASGRSYASVYERFLRNLSIPDDILDHAYESRIARHFYSDAERAAFRSGWSAGS